MKLIHIPIAAGLVLASATALAGPHFIKASGTFDSDEGWYTATFKEAGLGNEPVTYMLTASTETFTFQCYTRSGNTPQGAPNSQSFSNDSALTTLYPSRNGQISGSVSLTPEVGTASCQGGGLKLCLVAAYYEGIVLTDTNNNVTVQLGNAGGTLSKPDCDY